ncbi:UNVERIFIED_CONTAM: Retrovirus-related Pol polyprotein from transposon RE1 [Sesamum calycinum]|uniref:Retrovirus-related Pol polyprotein from transposon RE1 n=1 Tax=Sesamum calycinum TaxID=2727403 RepID=A0AAW2RS54_9LAMI
MSSDLRLLTNIQALKNSFFVRLPDGSKQLITYKGDVELLDRDKLYGVLYVSSFKHNLISEPKNFHEVQNQEEWKNAINFEIEALGKNGTWELVKAPVNKKAIGCCVYKLKLKSDGSIERYKARLVAKGYNQVEGEDYTDCFAPVAKAVIVRILLAVAVSKGWPIHHLDIGQGVWTLAAKDQVADIFAKPLSGPAFTSMKSKLNLVSWFPSSSCGERCQD